MQYVSKVSVKNPPLRVYQCVFEGIFEFHGVCYSYFHAFAHFKGHHKSRNSLVQWILHDICNHLDVSVHIRFKIDTNVGVRFYFVWIRWKSLICSVKWVVINRNMEIPFFYHWVNLILLLNYGERKKLYQQLDITSLAFEAVSIKFFGKTVYLMRFSMLCGFSSNFNLSQSVFSVVLWLGGGVSSGAYTHSLWVDVLL